MTRNELTGLLKDVELAIDMRNVLKVADWKPLRGRVTKAISELHVDPLVHELQGMPIFGPV